MPCLVLSFLSVGTLKLAQVTGNTVKEIPYYIRVSSNFECSSISQEETFADNKGSQVSMYKVTVISWGN